jgi:hypothetical protein
MPNFRISEREGWSDRSKSLQSRWSGGSARAVFVVATSGRDNGGVLEEGQTGQKAPGHKDTSLWRKSLSDHEYRMEGSG